MRDRLLFRLDEADTWGKLTEVLEHRDLHRDALVELAASARWMSDAARSDGLVRSTYSHVARGTPLWVTGRVFVEADGPLLPT